MTKAGNRWVCAVSVATVWTSSSAPRLIDDPGLQCPAQMTKWLEALPYPERLALCDENRVQTQLLYGEPVIVDEVEGDWAKVIAVWQSSKKDERGYPGWVPINQLKPAQPIEAGGYVKVRSQKAQLWNEAGNPSIVLSLNTILPFKFVEDDRYTVFTPDGLGTVLQEDVEVAPSIHQFVKRREHQIVQYGLQFLDLPYLWGGMSSYGYDCSGFTYNMMKANGYFIPRDASDQAMHGLEVDLHRQEEWQVGDLLFFANEKGTGPVRHVGFYFGDGQMLHSPSTGKSIEIMKLSGSALEEELCGVRRYVGQEGLR